MLSDKGIRQAVENGSLVIDPFDEAKLGPCSYDLTIVSLHRVNQFEAARLGEEDLPMKEFIEVCCEPYDGVLRPRKIYIGVSKESIGSSLMTEITSRSSMARKGVEIRQYDKSAEPSQLYCFINTCGTYAQVPEGLPMAQLIIGFDVPLHGEELRCTANSLGIGEPKIFKQGKPPSTLQSYEMVLLHLGAKIKVYNGNTFRNNSDDDCFTEIDITKPATIPPETFCLAPIEEPIRMPEDCAGMLRRSIYAFGSSIHPNAPLVQPGSEGHQVLEMYAAGFMELKAGMPVCGIEVYRLNPPPTKIYNGKYGSQPPGPLASQLHTELGAVG